MRVAATASDAEDAGAGGGDAELRRVVVAGGVGADEEAGASGRPAASTETEEPHDCATIDACQWLPRSQARRLSQRLFYGGFAALPGLWAANAWLFWPHLKTGGAVAGTDAVVRRCARPAAAHTPPSSPPATPTAHDRDTITAPFPRRSADARYSLIACAVVTVGFLPWRARARACGRAGAAALSVARGACGATLPAPGLRHAGVGRSPFCWAVLPLWDRRRGTGYRCECACPRVAAHHHRGMTWRNAGRVRR